MGIQETFGLSDQGLVDLYDGVIQKYGDSLTDSEVIQALEQEANIGVASEGAEYLLGKVDETLVNDSNREAVAELILSNPEFSEEDFMEILSEAFGDTKKSTKSVSKKAKTAAKKVNEPAKPKLDKKEYVSFDDLY
jgi:predicted HAD superfamily phosphohydrolase